MMIKKMIIGGMILLAAAGMHAQESNLDVTIVKKVGTESITEKYEVRDDQTLEDFLTEQGVDVDKLYDHLKSSAGMLVDLESDRKASTKPNPDRPFIGLRMTQSLKKVNGNEISRVFIKEVIPGGAAHLAGLKVNDQILSFDGEMVREIATVTDGVATKEVGGMVSMRVLRNGQMISVNMNTRTAANTMGEKNGYEDSDLSNNTSSATVFVKGTEEDEEVKMTQRLRFSHPPSLNKTERFKSIIVDMRKSFDAEEEALDVSGLSVLDITDLTVAPNPSQGSFDLSFSLENEEATKIRIMNVSGNLVYLEDLGRFGGEYQHRIDLQGALASGVYVLQIVRADSVHSEKLVIN